MSQHTNRAPDDETAGTTMIHIGGKAAPQEPNVSVRDMVTKVKKITTTDEGRLQVVLETEAMDDNAIAQVKDMLVLQQACLVQVTMVPVQPELFDA